MKTTVRLSNTDFQATLQQLTRWQIFLFGLLFWPLLILGEIPGTAARQKSLAELPQLIRSGSIHFESRDIVQCTEALKAQVESLCGYIAQEESEIHDNRIEYHLRARIPADQFDAFVMYIPERARTISESHLHAVDPRSESSDLAARLHMQRAIEKRYLALLQKTRNVRNVVNIEKQLSQTRLEIETLEARQDLLANQVTFSTLDLYYYQEYSHGQAFWQSVAQGLQDGWYLVKRFLLGLLSIWPVLLIALISLITYYLRQRKKKRSTVP